MQTGRVLSSLSRNRTYRHFKGEPLYTFGYGLSYTRFQYGARATSRHPFGWLSNERVFHPLGLLLFLVKRVELHTCDRPVSAKQ